MPIQRDDLMLNWDKLRDWSSGSSATLANIAD